MDKNYWSESEYSKHKLFLRNDKVESIFKVLSGKQSFDDIPPISVEFHLTNKCNIACPWCTDLGIRQGNESIETDRVLKLFDYFAENKVGVTIEGGGEPSVHKDFKKIVEYGAEKDLHMGLISNGVKNYSDVVKHFKWIRISLDSTNPDEYKIEKGVKAFDKVMKNLGTFSQERNPRDTHLGVGYVLTNRNNDVEGILNLLKELEDRGVDYMYIRPVEEAPDLTPDLESLLNLKKHLIEFTENSRIKALLTIHDRLVKNNDNLSCIAHSLACIIRADGTVALCEKRRHDPIILGNLYEDDFKTIWSSEHRREVTQKLLDPDSQKGCDVCRITSFNRVFADVTGIHTKNFI